MTAARRPFRSLVAVLPALVAMLPALAAMFPALAAMLLALGLSCVLRPAAYSTEEVRWRNGPVALAGTLYLPAGEGPHPAAVFLHGWGCATRTDTLFRVHAERLAGEGLAMLVYDKRGCGESTGHWREATLLDLAEDALGGVELLRGDARIRADGIGLFGTSLGGSVALLAALRSPEIAFVATLSLSTRSPVEHGHFILEETLRRKGYPEDAVAAAGDLDRRIKQTYRTNSGWDEARAAVERARSEPWFEDSGIALQPEAPGTWEWYRDLPMDFDNRPLLRSLEIPLFAAQGEADWLVPGARAAGVLRSLQTELDKDFTIVVIPEAEHTLRRLSGWPIRRWTWPESYWEALDAWLDDKAGAR